jgi:phosphatidylethanolamine/phosphatidyl-N-methylethanolamine N-methyltransferase
MPSSAALAEAMLAPIDFAKGPTVVEFGPGTGAFTRAIAARLRPPGRYLGIELNEAFCQTLAAEFPEQTFVHGSVADLVSILAAHGIARVDAIVCGLPWASLPIALQERVFGEIEQVLVPGGAFMTFAYLHGLALPGAFALRDRLQRSFATVSHSPVVWANVPPAFAYICRTKG